MINPRLIEYVKEEQQNNVSPATIRRTLGENEWTDADINEVFSVLGVKEHEGAGEAEGHHDSFFTERLTLDKVIEKFIPIIGALFLIVGFGYLLYANAWIHFPMEVRIGLGFFFSIAIIGGSFSFSEKMRYFSDIGIGSGVLLLYGTLIYGSRTTDLAAAVIPEVVTLYTAVLFTLAVSYFASKRNAKVILIVGMIGAYLTPFVIGQNDVWVQNVSFNAYLIYFLAINASVFLIGREISVRDIIPLNMLGLFIGVSTLWSLSATERINAVQPHNLFTGEVATAVLFMVITIFSMWSVLLSAKRFKERDDGYLSLGYIAPMVWFIFNVDNLTTLTDLDLGTLYASIAVACFVGWHVLHGAETRLQHAALYASGLVSATLGFFAFLPDLEVYTSMLIAYLSLLFACLYLVDPKKTERLMSYFVVCFLGSVLSVYHILSAHISFETLHIVAALVPAMCAYGITTRGGRAQFVPLGKMCSAFAAIIASLFILDEFLRYFEMNFILFYVAPLLCLSYLAFFSADLSHDSKSVALPSVLIWFGFGFASVFFNLVGSVYPAPTDTFLFTHLERATDWTLWKGIFATLILFIGLYTSRRLQSEQVIKRPSFILVIFGYATLLLTGSYIIYAFMNDLQISMAHGGPRAIATTLWWALIAIYMLYVGIRFGKRYYPEKLLGLLLLALTVCKVVLYDMATMKMQNKIVILMVVGGAMLLFSYTIRSKDLLKPGE